jgi:hypothetical protein
MSNNYMYKNIIQVNGLVDNNDLSFVIQHYGIPEMAMPCPYDDKNKVSPHVSRFLVNGFRVSVFHVKPVYYENKNGKWYPLSDIAEYNGNKNVIFNEKWEQASPAFMNWIGKRCELLGGKATVPIFSKTRELQYANLYKDFYYTTLTAYPDPNPESTTVDGRCMNGVTDNTWTVMQGGAGTSAQDSSAQDEGTFIQSSSTTNQYVQMSRCPFLFLTSSIGSDAISSATFSVVGYSKGDPGSWGISMNITSSAPASNTALVGGDFDSFGNTEFSTDISYASFNNAGYNNFTLNASGIAAINKAGVTKLGAREGSFDIPNSAPSWSSGRFAYLAVKYADTTGTSEDPKLVVVHAPAGAPYSQAHIIH